MVPWTAPSCCWASAAGGPTAARTRPNRQARSLDIGCPFLRAGFRGRVVCKSLHQSGMVTLTFPERNPSVFAVRFGASRRTRMTRFTPDQLAFAGTKRHYLNREEAIDFLKQMDIRMAVGHWSAGDFCDRFAPPGYHSDDPSFRNDFEGQCRRIKA